MTYCHRTDDPDLHCPGRPDRTPHAAKLHSDNNQNPDIDWLDEMRYWALVTATTFATAGVAALLAGYVIYRQ